MKNIFRKFALLCLCLMVLATVSNAQTSTYNQMQGATDLITTTNSNAQRVAPNYAVQANITVNTPAAAAFTCVAATDICSTSAANNFVTGLKGQGSTTTTLPGGLSTSTDYFVIRLSTTTFKLATSLANAQAGTAINITDTGTGTHTYTPTALAGSTIKLQASVDCVNFADISGTSTNITATANVVWNITSAGYNCVRSQTTLTAGKIQAVVLYSKSPE